MKRTVTIIASTWGFLLASLAMANSPGPSVNPYRAYPPSCLADPLPTTPTGPSWSSQVTLPAVTLATGQVSSTETVSVTLWRSPCSGGTSALLGLLQRSTQNEGQPAVQPIFPGFFITQGTALGQIARVAPEPNTVVSDLPAVLPTQYSLSFVVENFADPTAVPIDFSQAMVVTIGPSTPQLPQVNVNVPAYDATQYSDASPLPITGYLTGNWYDPTHSGEGIQTEIGELGTASTSRFISIAWYTFDPNGVPYWLFGSGTFNAGDISATVTLGWSSGGGFAGNFGANAPQNLWGTFVVDFPDCHTMSFTYATTGTSLPSYVPTGNGSRTWTRLTQMNGLNCE